jgi:hypothetical protein
LAKSVKVVVAEAIKPLVDEVNRFAKDFQARDAAHAALAETIEKGINYEEAVVTELQVWARALGAEVLHVGPDNRPGDIVVRFLGTSLAGAELAIVLEVRNRQGPSGRRVIEETLAKAISERKAHCGVYLSRTAEGLSQEIGEWGEGVCDGGPYIATTHQQLLFAIRWLVLQHRLAAAQATTPDLDVAAVEDQVKRIRTRLGRVATIKRKATDVRSSADDIQAEAEALRDEVRNALVAIEDAVRVVVTADAEAR